MRTRRDRTILVPGLGEKRWEGDGRRRTGASTLPQIARGQSVMLHFKVEFSKVTQTCHRHERRQRWTCHCSVGQLLHASWLVQVFPDDWSDHGSRRNGFSGDPSADRTANLACTTVFFSIVSVLAVTAPLIRFVNAGVRAVTTARSKSGCKGPKRTRHVAPWNGR